MSEILTPQELNDPVWQKLEARYTARLDTLRKQNDNSGLGEVETARLRGRIEEVKKLLSIGTPNPIQEDEA